MLAPKQNENPWSEWFETWHTSSPGQSVIDSEFTQSRVSGTGSASPRILRLSLNTRSRSFTIAKKFLSTQTT